MYAFADDFVKATPPRFKQMVELYNELGGSILTCVKAKDEGDFKRYGFIGGTELRSGVIELDSIVEKPGDRLAAPSDIASVSGYLLKPTIFSYLKQQKTELTGDGEFNQQVSMQRMIDDGHKLYGFEVPGGIYYDTGNKLEYLKTVVDFALQHPELGDDFRRFLQTRLDT
jgi:UTP--glucose-1-phosphate uridylyltransferase